MTNLITDIVSNWSFTDGDLNIVTGEGNLVQAIQNRLNTYMDDLSIFYQNYGSTIFDEIGELNHPTIHEYIKIEVESCLIRDNRINNVECTVEKNDNDQKIKENDEFINIVNEDDFEEIKLKKKKD